MYVLGVDDSEQGALDCPDWSQSATFPSQSHPVSELEATSHAERVKLRGCVSEPSVRRPDRYWRARTSVSRQAQHSQKHPARSDTHTSPLRPPALRRSTPRSGGGETISLVPPDAPTSGTTDGRWSNIGSGTALGGASVLLNLLLEPTLANLTAIPPFGHLSPLSGSIRAACRGTPW